MHFQRYWLVPLVACFIGCADQVVTHEARKPIVEVAHQEASPLDEVLSRLGSERSRHQQALPGLEQRKRTSLDNLRLTLGADFQQLMDADGVGISLFFAQRADPAAEIHARELASHVEHQRRIERRLELLTLAIDEGESWQRLAQNYRSTGSVPPANYALVAKLGAVANQHVELPSEVSPDQVADVLASEFAFLRQEIESEKQQRREAEARAAREAELAAARREELEQRAMLEAARRAAELAAHHEAEQLRAEKHAAELADRREAQRREAEQKARALKLFADAYHAFYYGEVRLAEELLSEAIDLDATDARFHYYRGLARYRMGQQAAAEADFRVGGEAERRGSFGVGKALERVQGAERLVLERFRR